jgi:hypothetical protein
LLATAVSNYTQRAGLFEPSTAIGVWATRPQTYSAAVKKGDSPSFTLYCGKGKRVALPRLLSPPINAKPLSRCLSTSESQTLMSADQTPNSRRRSFLQKQTRY